MPTCIFVCQIYWLSHISYLFSFQFLKLTDFELFCVAGIINGLKKPYISDYKF